MRTFIKWIAVSACLCSIGSPAAAQTTGAQATLFQNVRIFDGTHKSLSAPSNVLVRGNRIERDGNPIENIALVADPARNFLVIMKDGVVYKNTLAAGR